MKWKPLRILFIGDEPSSKNKCPNTPFVGTPSYKRLLRWIGELDLDVNNIKIVNKTEVSKDSIQDFDFLIFLGEKAYQYSLKIKKIPITASKNPIDLAVLTMTHRLEVAMFAGEKFSGRFLPYFLAPHPSPRNRNFNKPGYEAKMLKDLKRWLYE